MKEDNPFNQFKTEDNKITPVVKSSKKLAKQYLFGHVSNGGGVIKLSDGYALKFIALDEKYVDVYLLDYGKDTVIPTQTWTKTKEIKRKKEPEIVFSKTESNERKSLF